jgi:hypothetical protein
MVIVPLLMLPAAVALAFWARWLGRRYGTPKVVRYLPWTFLGAWLIGTIGAAAFMLKMFGAVSGESIDPSQKARILAEGISESMNMAACSIAFFVLGALVMLLLTWRYHWAAKPEDPGGTPPYR